ncbi:hypothetical protein Hanom_Chr12g01134911 [Helianthus anomalus]
MARLLALRIVIEPATFSFWCKSDAPLTMMKTTVEGLEGSANQLSCVMNFGGSSVALVDRMKEVAEYPQLSRRESCDSFVCYMQNYEQAYSHWNAHETTSLLLYSSN